MQKLMITVLFASSTVAVLGAADCDAAFGAESCTAQPTSNLLQMEKAEAHGAIIASETPAYEMNKTDTKCSQQGGDRLFRVEDLDLDGCYQQCSSTAGCNYFSIALQGQYKGVCMGCKTGITDPHDKFIFYNMGPLVSTTTTSTVSVVTPFTLNATNIKCAYRHADRLFRKTGLDTHGCYIECSNTANCNYFSVALEGPYAGVCMGCVQGVTQPHKSFNFYSMPSDEPLPDAQDQCDEMAYTDRVDCGWWGVTPEACMEKAAAGGWTQCQTQTTSHTASGDGLPSPPARWRMGRRQIAVTMASLLTSANPMAAASDKTPIQTRTTSHIATTLRSELQCLWEFSAFITPGTG
eukprot:CAMPEP_0178431686 /NCGR_PEP_ID=MMETSP0689_2-20121128/31985_1 /TAXON_ID=160604 /ORGANISM="Amphidinium massartii, Strain CS-259" /LENGTH=350 /DNA_ID=CAMNT_0020053625 /DNA_START=62 /DNA_END=1115 /DNA_ORIENTATION=+